MARRPTGGIGDHESTQALPEGPRSPKDLPFQDLLKLAHAFGFELSRINGSHHILVHPDVDNPLNLQEVGGKAKPYQLRQLIRLVEENDSSFEDWK